jgi:hypothetical protein
MSQRIMKNYFYFVTKLLKLISVVKTAVAMVRELPGSVQGSSDVKIVLYT